MFKTAAIALLTALIAATFPVAPARADGAASTRNIILGGALAAGTLIVVNHNKKVHQKEAEMDSARRQAEAQRNEAYASDSQLHSRVTAQNREIASLKQQLAQQHAQLQRLQRQIGSSNDTRTAFIAPAPKVAAPATVRVASESYGWGHL